MSTAQARPSHATQWIFTGIALTLLYFFTAPAIWATAFRPHASARWKSTSFDPRQANWLVKAADWYSIPYYWVDTHTPMEPLTTAYHQWWERVVLPP